MPKKIRVKIYPKLLRIWPEVCSACCKMLKDLDIHPFDPKLGTGGFELHHIRYDVRLDDIRFIRFMCHGCNHRSEFRRSELEKYHHELGASMYANLDKHQIFLDWFSDEMEANHCCMIRSEIIESGAYISGANVKTVERWLLPLCSKEGPFSKPTKIGGVLCIYVKGKNIERFPTIDDYQAQFNKVAEDLKKD